MHKIKITANEPSIFGQYKAIYLNPNTIRIIQQGYHGGRIELNVNQGDEITVDLNPVKRKVKIGDVLNCDGIFSIFALNTKNGGVLSITKILN